MSPSQVIGQAESGEVLTPEAVWSSTIGAKNIREKVITTLQWGPNRVTGTASKQHPLCTVFVSTINHLVQVALLLWEVEPAHSGACVWDAILVTGSTQATRCFLVATRFRSLVTPTETFVAATAPDVPTTPGTLQPESNVHVRTRVTSWSIAEGIKHARK